MPSVPVRYPQRLKRVHSLKDSDYDHEIGLVDEDKDAGDAKARAQSPAQRHSGQSRNESQSDANAEARDADQAQEQAGTRDESATAASLSTSPPADAGESEPRKPSSGVRLSQGDDGVEREDHFQDARETVSPRQSRDAEGPHHDVESGDGPSDRRLETQDTNQVAPSVEVQSPTPFERASPHANGDASQPKPKKRQDVESEIEVLWENERGCFLCGRALFSAAALGNLDPPPWTNRFFKASPTSIRTAQVPDPSWEWAWPEWRINREDGVTVDEFGWEYSFMFSKRFSWHGPKWWNSFVRRRAWIRKRTKKNSEDVPSDPHMLNTDYFSVTPARARPSSVAGGSSYKGSRGSKASVRSRESMRSKPSLSQLSKEESILEEKPDIEDVWMLMLVLRAARIDREKIEAVENYLEHSLDNLEGLQHEMHEIMGIFIFQASRRLLLSRLTHAYDDMGRAEKDDDATGDFEEKRANLGAAVEHADEEVRRLSYWSDVKRLAEGGVSTGAVEDSQGWGEVDWQGVDQSGPGHASPEKLSQGRGGR